jgi:hypothetical protein
MIYFADEVEVIRHCGDYGYLQVTPGFPESQAFDYRTEAARVGQLIYPARMTANRDEPVVISVDPFRDAVWDDLPSKHVPMELFMCVEET